MGAGRGGDDDAVDAGIQHGLGESTAVALPIRAVTASTAAPTGSVTTSSSTRSRAARVSAWKAPIRPRPMSPMRIRGHFLGRGGREDIVADHLIVLSTICSDKLSHALAALLEVGAVGPRREGPSA